MALFSCCNCDPTTDEETQVDIDSGSRGVAGDRPCFGMDGTLLLTPEQKQREKERLQALVKAFAKAAVAGASCFFVDVPSQQQIAAHYMLDKGLKTFTVVFPNGVEHSFPLAFLQDVYSYDDLLHSPSTLMLAQEPGISGLSDEEKRRLVMLEYMDSSERHLSRLFLMETEDDRRDRFLTCMRILKLYSLAPLTSPPANGNNSTATSARNTDTASAVEHPVGNGR